MRPTKSSATISEEKSIIGGLFYRIAGFESGVLPDDLTMKSVPLEDETPAKNPEISVRDVSKSFSPAVKIESLDISATGESMSSDFAIDRALMAFKACGKGTDFVRRSALSAGIIKMLNIDGLAKRSQIYGSVRGAMRALLMSCCEKGYIERIMYGPNSTNGYRLTEEGKKRMDLISGTSVESFASNVEAEPVDAEPHSNDADKTIIMLKSMISEHESIKKQISDLGELIAELENESENDSLMLNGLDQALSEKVSERDALDKEISRLRSKMEVLREGEDKKAKDALELKAEMEKLAGRKREIESRLSVRS
jgi:hypothetical protein